MTPFTVVLVDTAEDDLARIWLASPNPAEVTRADAAIHRLLSADPFGNSSPVIEGLYRITHGPLIAYFAVLDASRTVEVSAFALRSANP